MWKQEETEKQQGALKIISSASNCRVIALFNKYLCLCNCHIISSVDFLILIFIKSVTVCEEKNIQIEMQ